MHGITRIDPTTGASRTLSRGGLDVVDHYDWADARTLRWRSRSPSDPPFRDTRLTYVLEYTYTNVLQPKGGGEYELDHDFAFAERPGTIRRFTLDLTLDPVWIPRGPVPTGVVAVDLAPGRGYVTRLGLGFRGEGSPAGVDVWGPRVAVAAWTALFVLPPLVLGNAWWRERRAGRLDPLPATSREWLEQNVLSVPAEVIGAAWDEQVGAPFRLLSRSQTKPGAERGAGGDEVARDAHQPVGQVGPAGEPPRHGVRQRRPGHHALQQAVEAELVAGGLVARAGRIRAGPGGRARSAAVGDLRRQLRAAQGQGHALAGEGIVEAGRVAHQRARPGPRRGAPPGPGGRWRAAARSGVRRAPAARRAAASGASVAR